MEMVYIIPQLINPDELLQAKSTCTGCNQYIKLRHYPTALEMEDLKPNLEENTG